MRRVAAVLVLALAAGQATGAIKRPRSPKLYPEGADRSIAWTWYDTTAAYRLCVRPGRQVSVQLSEREEIYRVALGFEKAWQFEDWGSGFNLKQLLPDPTSDLTVWTRAVGGLKRRYFFDLRVCEPLRMLTFRYRAADVAAAAVAAAPAAPAPAPAVVRPVNDRYSGQPANEASEALRPVGAWNDGTFTHLTFAAGQALPVVYRVEGRELAQVAFHMTHERDAEGVPVRSTMVVHRVADRLLLQLGDRAFCIFNEDMMR